MLNALRLSCVSGTIPAPMQGATSMQEGVFIPEAEVVSNAFIHVCVIRKGDEVVQHPFMLYGIVKNILEHCATTCKT